MRDKMYQTLMRKYEAEVADAKFKIDTFVERTIIIQERLTNCYKLLQMLRIKWQH